jgi:hypothetical protein
MPLFIVATTSTLSEKALKEKIARHFPYDNYEIGKGQWLISYPGIARTLFERLAEGDQGSIVDTVTFGISGYYGYASQELWEWIAAKSKGRYA